jgi:hypothetical protein
MHLLRFRACSSPRAALSPLSSLLQLGRTEGCNAREAPGRIVMVKTMNKVRGTLATYAMHPLCPHESHSIRNVPFKLSGLLAVLRFFEDRTKVLRNDGVARGAWRQ